MKFSTDYKEILALVDAIDPENYARTRNFEDGAVTRLSPYISRGVISTKMIYESILKKGYKAYKIEKFVQELAWRDYFQSVHKALGDKLFEDIKQPQEDVHNHKIPANIEKPDTGIQAIDTEINKLYKTGYMHNHCRMYVAGMVCNIAKSYWEKPSQWLYYHLMDADIASNTCSWQWVAGSFSGKKYFANQDNINRYFYSKQKDTYLDKEYAELVKMAVPAELQELKTLDLHTDLPSHAAFKTDAGKPILLYNAYNIDPLWRADEDAERVLILEPSVFKKFPMCEKTIQFIETLFKNIIKHNGRAKIFCGDFKEFISLHETKNIIYKEHPLNAHYEGTCDERDWMFTDVKKYVPSFFKYYKMAVKQAAK